MSKTIKLSDETVAIYAGYMALGHRSEGNLAQNEVVRACKQAMIPEPPSMNVVNDIKDDVRSLSQRRAELIATWIEYVLKNGYTL